MRIPIYTLYSRIALCWARRTKHFHFCGVSPRWRKKACMQYHDGSFTVSFTVTYVKHATITRKVLALAICLPVMRTLATFT